MDKKIEELLPFYALDALTDEEREFVEAYLREHPEARRELDEMAAGASALPHSVPPVEPPRRIKDALMVRVHADASLSKVKQATSPRDRNRVRWASLLPAFSLGVATVAVIWAVMLNTQLTRLQSEVSLLRDTVLTQADSLEQITQLRNEVSLLQDALKAQSDSLQQISAKLDQPTPAGTVTISL